MRRDGGRPASWPLQAALFAGAALCDAAHSGGRTAVRLRTDRLRREGQSAE